MCFSFHEWGPLTLLDLFAVFWFWNSLVLFLSLLTEILPIQVLFLILESWKRGRVFEIEKSYMTLDTSIFSAQQCVTFNSFIILERIVKSSFKLHICGFGNNFSRTEVYLHNLQILIAAQTQEIYTKLLATGS